MRANPFRPGDVSASEYFVGRDQQLEVAVRLEHELENGQFYPPICFLAPAGLGKTTLLKRIGDELEKRSWLFGYTVADSSLSRTLIELFNDAGRAVPAKRLGQRLRASLEELKVSIGPVGLSVSLAVSQEQEANRDSPYLKCVSLLGELARSDSAGVALLVDEAQALRPEDLDFMLRTVNCIGGRPVGVILAGLPNILDILDNVTLSTPYAHISHLRPLSREDARFTLSAPIEDRGGEYEILALEEIIDFAEGHPLILQRLGYYAWLHADRETPNGEDILLRRSHATEAIKTVKSELSNSTFKPLWARCSKEERVVLAALAFSGDVPLSEERLIADLVPRASDPFSALQELVGRGVIYDQEDLVDFALPGLRSFVRSRGSLD
jgi:AAA ATPase domain